MNTLPEKTIQAFLDHGKVKNAFTCDASDAVEIDRSLEKNFNIETEAIGDTLREQGVQAFETAFDELLQSIETKAKKLCGKI